MSARSLDVPFQEAWRVALRQALDRAPQRERRDWRVAIEESRGEWNAAFHRQPATIPTPAAQLLFLDAPPVVDGRMCVQCPRLIPDERPRSEYCSESCRRSHNTAVERARRHAKTTGA